MKNLKFVFLYLFILFGFVSCNNLLSAKKTGSIKFELPEINDIYRNSDNDNDPHFEDPLNINFKITVESPENNYKYTKEIKQKDTLTIVDLNPGEYKIFVEYNSKLNSFAGYQTVSVVPGEIAETTIYLEDKIPTSIDDVKYVVDKDVGVLMFTITTKTEYSIPHLFNENYDIAMCAPECSKTKEYTYYFPFCENGKRYVFTLGKDDGDGWKSTKFAVIYDGENSNYSINTDLIEYYNNNFNTKINLDEKNNYNLNISGILTDPEKNIFNNTITIDKNSYYLNYQLWSGDENNLSWIAEDYISLQNDMNNTDLTDFINKNYDKIKNNKNNQIWTYIFFDVDYFNQRFRLLDKFSKPFELFKPEYDETVHIKAEYVDNGIKVTLLPCQNDQYATQGDGAGNLRVCDFNTNYYSVILNDIAIETLNKNNEFSFIWPFANDGEVINLELQYFLQSDNTHECLKEWVTVKSGKGEYYTEQPYNNWDLFEIYNDNGGINKRSIKSKLTYEELMNKIPKNANNIRAEFVIEGTNSQYAWNWDDRKWIVSFGGSFDQLDIYNDTQIPDMMKDGNYNFLLSKLFSEEGLDIADLKKFNLWKDGEQIFSELENYNYIIPTIDISFTVNDDELSKYATYSTVFQCGDVKKEPLTVLDETNSFALNYHFGNMVYTERNFINSEIELPIELSYFQSFNYDIAYGLKVVEWKDGSGKTINKVSNKNNDDVDVYLSFIPIMSNWNGNGEEGDDENDYFVHIPAKVLLPEQTVKQIAKTNQNINIRMSAEIDKTPDITKENSIALNILDATNATTNTIDLTDNILTATFTLELYNYPSSDNIYLDLIYLDDFSSDYITFKNLKVEVLDENNSYKLNYHFGNMVYTERVGYGLQKKLPTDLSYLTNWNWCIGNNLLVDEWTDSNGRTITEIDGDITNDTDVYLNYKLRLHRWGKENGNISNGYPLLLFFNQEQIKSINSNNGFKAQINADLSSDFASDYSWNLFISYKNIESDTEKTIVEIHNINNKQNFNIKLIDGCVLPQDFESLIIDINVGQYNFSAGDDYTLENFSFNEAK